MLEVVFFLGGKVLKIAVRIGFVKTFAPVKAS